MCYNKRWVVIDEIINRVRTWPYKLKRRYKNGVVEIQIDLRVKKQREWNHFKEKIWKGNYKLINLGKVGLKGGWKVIEDWRGNIDDWKNYKREWNCKLDNNSLFFLFRIKN